MPETSNPNLSGDSIAAPRDRDDDYWSYFDAKQKQYLKSLVCDEIIEEHRNRPLGQHTEPLARLLHYFRRLPLEQQYAIRRNDTADSYSIVRLSGTRGKKPSDASEIQLDTVEEAYHKVFMLQVGELMRG